MAQQENGRGAEAARRPQRDSRPRTHKGPRIGLATVEPMKLKSIVPTNSQMSETANLRERTLW